MKVRLVDWWGSEKLICRAARLCHRVSWEETVDAFSEGFLRFLIKKGHCSPFEFAGATVLVEEAPIYTARQLMRHRHFSFMERSLQYAELPLEPSGDDPFLAYRAAGQMGQTKREARKVLPLLTPTTFLMSGNLRTWMEMVQKRTVQDAEPEAKEFAEVVFAQLSEMFPSVRGWIG